MRVFISRQNPVLRIVAFVAGGRDLDAKPQLAMLTFAFVLAVLAQLLSSGIDRLGPVSGLTSVRTIHPERALDIHPLAGFGLVHVDAAPDRGIARRRRGYQRVSIVQSSRSCCRIRPRRLGSSPPARLKRNP
jgi:hypothetical protein